MFSNPISRGFTLVELLLVVLILAILAGVLIPKFNVSERQAQQNVGTYNQSAVQAEISDFKSLSGSFPSNFHTGFTDATGAASVPGLSADVALNLASGGTAGASVSSGKITNNFTQGNTVTAPAATCVQNLTAGQVQALRDNGIHTFACGGYTTADGPTGSEVPLSASTPKAWVLTGGKELYRGGTLNFDGSGTVGSTVVTLQGRPLSSFQFDPEGVVLVFVTPDVLWDAVLQPNPNDTGFGNMTSKSAISVAKAPRDPLATAESTFPYYIAVFYLAPEEVGSKSGFSAELLGVLDSNLNETK